MSLPSRPSLHPSSLAGSGPGGSSASASSRQRQYAHLAAQLAQLHARLADLENLVRMTSVQAGDVRGLGGWMGGLFMASSRILGEESIAGSVGAKEAESAKRKAEMILRQIHGGKEYGERGVGGSEAEEDGEEEAGGGAAEGDESE